MMSGEKGTMGVRLGKWWGSWRKDTKRAIEGIGAVMCRPGYSAIAVLCFLLFSFLFALFQDGTSTWGLLWSGLPVGDKLGVVGEVWLRVLRNFVDPWGLVLLVLAVMQGMCISLLIYSIRERASRKDMVSGAEAGGVGMAISLVILGCPGCGTSVLVPFLTMMMGSGAMALAGVLGAVLTVVAAILLLYAVRKLGYGAYLESKGLCKSRKVKNVAKS